MLDLSIGNIVAIVIIAVGVIGGGVLFWRNRTRPSEPRYRPRSGSGGSGGGAGGAGGRDKSRLE